MTNSSVAIPRRPMKLGDILNQTINLYRQRFSIWLSIMFWSTLPLLALEFAFGWIELPWTQWLSKPDTLTNDPQPFLRWLGALWALLIIGLSIAMFQWSAVAVVVVGDGRGQNIGASAAWGQTLRRSLALLLITAIFFVVNVLLSFVSVLPIAVMASLLMMWGASSWSLILCTLGAFLLALLAPLMLVLVDTYWAFAWPIVVLEKIGGVAALRRSWRLTQRAFWRVSLIAFVLLLAVGAVSNVPALLASSFAYLVAPTSAFVGSINIMIRSVIGIVTMPLYFIAMTLLYCDLRGRREGYEWLLSTETD